MTPSPNWQDDLARARAGDRDALGRLFDAVQSYLHHIASRELPANLRAKEDAADLVQQTFAEASQSFRLFRGDAASAWQAWLRRILLHNLHSCQREFHTHKRSIGREKALDGKDVRDSDMNRVASAEPGPIDMMIALEREMALAHALARLPERHHTVIRWRSEECFSFDEIGRKLGLSADAAQKLWTRAVAHLRQELGDAC